MFLLRIQIDQKRQIAWFKTSHKALVLIPNINEVQIGALEHTQSTCATAIRPKSSGIQSICWCWLMQIFTRIDKTQKQQTKQLWDSIWCLHIFLSKDTWGKIVAFETGMSYIVKPYNLKTSLPFVKYVFSESLKL